MHEIVPGLYASEPQPLIFAPDTLIRAFLIRGADGNTLVYANDRIAEEADEIKALGGLRRHVLGHWHEASMGAADIAEQLGAPVLCHEADRAKAEEDVPIAETFDQRRALADDLEAIPIPGHTRGSTAYLWAGPEHRCLFTTDSLLVGERGWYAVVLGESNRKTYAESLRMLRDLDFDLLVPWGASQGAEPATPVDRDTARREIDAVIARLESGSNR